ncbi:MAG: class I SAM-dependent methyltransferase [Deltaproteobacteria bacterium]|nr:class I SAM-dependent methyltransferase [Deltaproteobacteria bacterium]MBW1956616.1 class I SAM-dependent methyltransferase [Deltaproteobacteria bacterium]MBW2133012.1 class I SAM-dependent methyltransferase [Deltaproteobacteria bacterium]
MWFDPKKRRQAADPSNSPVTCFGYQPVSLDEKARRIYRHFESIAQKYDFMNTLLSFGIHYPWKRLAVRMLGLKKEDRVIDVCAGTGDLALMAAKRLGGNGFIVLYDINRAMMEAGRHKTARCGAVTETAFVQGNTERMAFPDASFDAAMVGFGIRNLTRPRVGFSEIHRVLKPGGAMVCLEFSKPTSPVFRGLYDFYSFRIMPLLGQLLAGSRKAYTHLPESIRTWPLPDELSEMLSKIGFSDVRYRRLTNGIAVIHRAVKGTRHPPGDAL